MQIKRKWLWMSGLIIPCLLVVGILLGKMSLPVYSGYMISLSFFAGYIWFVYSALKLTGTLEAIRSIVQREKNIMICMYIIVNVIILSLLMKSNMVHYWDYGAYWDYAISHVYNFFANPLGTLVNLYNSVNQSEYNYLIPCVLTFPMKLLGTNYTIYALLIFNLFVGPSFLAILGCVMKISKKMSLYKDQHMKYVFFVLISCVSVYAPVLIGYCDAFSLAFLSMAFLLFYDDYLAQFDFEKSLFLGGALLGAMLGRRYFAFAVVGFALFVMLGCLIRWIRINDKKELLMSYIKNGLVVVATMAIPLLLFFREFIILSLSGNKAVAYSAYQLGDVWFNYELIVSKFGYIYFILGFLAVIACLKYKSARIDIILTVVYIMVTTYYFFTVQSMGNHHVYTILVPILVLSMIGVIMLLRKRWRLVTGIALLLVGVNLCGTLQMIELPKVLKPYFSQLDISPIVRHDLVSLRLLTGQLRQLSDAGSRIYVLASSTTINDDIIRKSNLPDESNSVPGMFNSFHIDLRDGMPTEFFTADIVVVANPVQVHAGEENQRIISLLANEFNNQTGISSNYTAISTYSLDYGVTVTIYQKQSEYTVEQLKYVQELFDQYYPDAKELFHDRMEAYIQSVQSNS